MCVERGLTVLTPAARVPDSPDVSLRMRASVYIQCQGRPFVDALSLTSQT